MSRSRSFWQFAGFVFTAVAGTLFHFLYDWSGQQVAVGLFAAVNESIWEHMKLLFFPMLIFAVVQWLVIGREDADHWCVTSLGIVMGTLLVPVLYYAYSGAFGINADYVNVTIFFVAAAIAYSLQAFLFRRGTFSCRYPALAVAVLLGIAVLFGIFTFTPPEIPLFEDPINSSFGILQK